MVAPKTPAWCRTVASVMLTCAPCFQAGHSAPDSVGERPGACLCATVGAVGHSVCLHHGVRGCRPRRALFDLSPAPGRCPPGASGYSDWLHHGVLCCLAKAHYVRFVSWDTPAVGKRRWLSGTRAHPGTVIDCIMASCAVLQRYTMFDLFPGAPGRPRGASGYSD